MLRVGSVLYLSLLLLQVLCPCLPEGKRDRRLRVPSPLNWSALITQPSAYIAKANYKIRKRRGGAKPSSTCSNYVGLAYLDNIRDSRHSICVTDDVPAPKQDPDSSFLCEQPSACRSAIDCVTAPIVRDSSSTKKSISLCHSRNLILDSCAFYAGARKSSWPQTFPAPTTGAIRLACQPANLSTLTSSRSSLRWLSTAHNHMWWGAATRDPSSVATACAPDSPTLVTVPTLFLTRDGLHGGGEEDPSTALAAVASYFALMAAIEPQDVAAKGVQVVIVDTAPPSASLELWDRISHPHPLRFLPSQPFPSDTCFRSAFHIHSVAAGPAHNPHPATLRCESPVVTAFSHWLRQLYDEPDPWARSAPSPSVVTAAVAGPAAADMGIWGLRPPTGGMVVRNLLWLRGRRSDAVRLLVSIAGGGAYVRSGAVHTRLLYEEAVVAGLQAAVQEWNAESCLLRRFDRAVQREYELSLEAVNPIHSGAVSSKTTTTSSTTTNTNTTSGIHQSQDAKVSDDHRTTEEGKEVPEDSKEETAEAQRAAAVKLRRALLKRLLPAATGASQEEEERRAVRRRRLVAGTSQEEEDVKDVTMASGEQMLDEHQFDGDGDDEEEQEDEPDVSDMISGPGSGAPATSGGGSGNGTASGTRPPRHPYMIGNNIILLDKLWEQHSATGDDCRRTNVLFKFVDGEYDNVPYDELVQTLFRTGVLAGMQAGGSLALGFFLPPGQSAVMQLLEQSKAKSSFANVYRNMAAGMGNGFEDFLYDMADLDIAALKEAAKRAMDWVAQQVMDAQRRRTGVSLRLVLVDQSHFSVTVPSKEQCPARAAAAAAGWAAGGAANSSATASGAAVGTTTAGGTGRSHAT